MQDVTLNKHRAAAIAQQPQEIRLEQALVHKLKSTQRRTKTRVGKLTVKMRRPVLSKVTQYTDDKCPRILLCIFMCVYTAVGTS